MDVSSTFTDRLSTVGGTFGLLTGFSLISGVEIVYFLAKFFISLLSRKGKISEYLQIVANFGKPTTSVSENSTGTGVMEEDTVTVKSLEKQMRNMSETWMKQMNKLQSDLEMVQMREKQAEFGDSNAGVFFDAIFKNKIQPNTEEDNQI